MGVARVAEALGHDAEALGAADAVLDGNAEAAWAGWWRHAATRRGRWRRTEVAREIRTEVAREIRTAR